MTRVGVALQSGQHLAALSLSTMYLKKQVVAYCRVSTLEQHKKGLGMDIQMRDVNAFAQAQKLTLDRIYPDHAESGAKESRKELKKLLRGCKRREVKTIIIPSLDRLSRDVRIAENLFYQFKQLGVRVLIADMPFYDGENRRDVLIRQIREAIAEENRKDIIERLWKGRQERVRKGKPAGGNIPYGYRRKGKGWVVDHGEAEIVRHIFELSADGISLTDIAETLNRQGASRRNGRGWTTPLVHAVLNRADLYIYGKIRYGMADGMNQKLVLIQKEEL